MSITTIRTDGLEASVDSAGAQLMSLRLEGVEYLWQGDPTWWPRRAPVLFPIVGNLRDGRAESAQGEVRLGRHGLARGLEHAIERAEADSVTYDLKSTPETRDTLAVWYAACRKCKLCMASAYDLSFSTCW